MRRTYFVLIVLALAGFLLPIKNSIVASDESQKLPVTLADFQRDFELTRDNDWQARRRICIDLIDAGYLSEGKSLVDVAKVVGSYGVVLEGKVTERCTILVVFKKQNVRVDESVQFGVDGWYLMLTTNANGEINSYSHSNFLK